MQGNTDIKAKSLALELLPTKTVLSLMALFLFFVALIYFFYAASLENSQLVFSSIIFTYTIFINFPGQNDEEFEIKSGLIFSSVTFLISILFMIVGYSFSDIHGMVIGQIVAVAIFAVIRGEGWALA
ncbi:MAG: hypothetical protein ACOYOJ_02325 [Alsobacter sp.]